MNRRRDRFPNSETFHSTTGVKSEAGEILWAEYDRSKISKFTVYARNLVEASGSVALLTIVRKHLFEVVEKDHPEKFQSFLKNVATLLTRNKKKELGV